MHNLAELFAAYTGTDAWGRTVILNMARAERARVDREREALASAENVVRIPRVNGRFHKRDSGIDSLPLNSVSETVDSEKP
jgi:hypothetical protein